MCVICVSPKGESQPTKATLETMFESNSHGAGFMYARNGKVHIHKGFMDFTSYWKAIKNAKLTKADSAVYHCRISTQAGINPEMTHPFPWTTKLEDTKLLDCTCQCGIAHNGVVRMTSTGDKEYSDTALYIAWYLSKLIRTPEDMEDGAIADLIDVSTNSKWAILRADGFVLTVGKWIEDNGLLFSNDSYKPYIPRFYSASNVKKRSPLTKKTEEKELEDMDLVEWLETMKAEQELLGEKVF